MKLSWDLQALLILVTVAGAMLIVPVLIVWVQRTIKWYGCRHLRMAYLPHSNSHVPWRENQWKFPGENQRVSVHRKTRSKKPGRLTLVGERMVSR